VTAGRVEQSLRALVAEVVRDELEKQRAKTARPDTFLSTAEAAELARVHQKTIVRWIKSRRQEEHSAGREYRVRRADLEQYLRAGRRRRPAHEDLTDRERSTRWWSVISVERDATQPLGARERAKGEPSHGLRSSASWSVVVPPQGGR
jgi:excisionase family DNA binding protein